MELSRRGFLIGLAAAIAANATILKAVASTPYLTSRNIHWFKIIQSEQDIELGVKVPVFLTTAGRCEFVQLEEGEFQSSYIQTTKWCQLRVPQTVLCRMAPSPAPLPQLI